MGLTIQIRRATLGEAADVAALKQAIWPDEGVDYALVRQVLARPEHDVRLATVGGASAGFVAGFATRDAAGRLRWEIDLLAVLPPFRGQGLGARLIAASLEFGRRQGATVARALVQVSNRPAQQALRRNDFRPTRTAFRLLTSTAAARKRRKLPSSAWLIPVTTLAYSGYWLEGQIDEAAVQAALAQRAAEGRDLVGLLWPEPPDHVFPRFLADFRSVGVYRWWLTR